MGVRGLKTYVDSLPVGEGKVWEWFDLRDTKVVIDGCGLYYHLYISNGTNFIYGGQYDDVKKELQKFITKLKSNNVKPYVVFDGILKRDDIKFDTYKERKIVCVSKVESLCNGRKLRDGMVLPLLAQLTVVQVLREMKVPYAIADFEADCEIASLANALDAPVMADDTDFCIFNINRGYIPFPEYYFITPDIRVRKFSRNAFINHLGINPRMLPLLASLIGNDYISKDMLKVFADKVPMPDVGGGRIPRIAKFLSEHNSVSEAIAAVKPFYPNEERSAFERALLLSIQEYQMKQSNLIDYFDSGDLSCSVRTYNGHLLPEWVIELYRQGLIAPEGLSCWCNREVFLPTQCESISLPSAQRRAQDLRWHYYALALHFQAETLARGEDIIVREFCREEEKLVLKEKNLTRTVSDVQIQDIPEMSDQARKSYLLSILQCDERFIHDLPIEHQLAASALRYWFMHPEKQVNPEHLAALLVHYVGENEETEAEFPLVPVDVVHRFAEWQNVLYWVERLNALFFWPFEQLQVTRLYNGIHVCNVYKRLSSYSDVGPETIVSDVELYHRLYRAITTPMGFK